MSRSTADTTRAALLSAAERLFAERGIDGVSLREINRASGARNAIAVQYHFDDRAGVVQAILAKHRNDIEARRHALLDQYEAAGADDLRALVGALVRPQAAKLADPDGGPEFLQIQADLVNRPQAAMDGVEDGGDELDSTYRWRALVAPLIDPEAVRLHRRFTAIKGEIPSPLAPPTGCHFHPRCPFAFARCSVEVPPLFEVAPGHWSACHLNDASAPARH